MLDKTAIEVEDSFASNASTESGVSMKEAWNAVSGSVLRFRWMCKMSGV